MADVDELDLQELQAFMGVAVPAASAAAEPAPKAGGYAKTAPAQAEPQQAAAQRDNAASEASEAKAADLEGPVKPKHDNLVAEETALVTVQNAEDLTLPYLSIKNWDELSLPKEILDGIYEHGFIKPSKIQEVALPITMKGGNLIGQAQNGSGKTAAFALSLLHATNTAQNTPQGLCVNPTRELSRQNADVIEKLGKFTGVRVFLAVPGCSFSRRVEHHIIVGTPGKLQDLLKKRVIDVRSMKMFVIDEADQLIDEYQSMGTSVFQIRKMLPVETQTILFSATFPDHVAQFSDRMVPKAHKITVLKEDLTLATIMQTFIDCGDNWKVKDTVLSDLYGAMNVGQSIIFVNSRQSAFDLAKRMKSEGHALSLICGTQKTGPEQIDPGYRDKVMDEFRSGVSKVLIATDVLSRGIDVPAVTLVVNYDIPMSGRWPNFETYQHRIGRTGRFGLKGIAVNLVTTRDRWQLEEIQKHYKCEMKEMSPDCEHIERCIKELR